MTARSLALVAFTAAMLLPAANAAADAPWTTGTPVGITRGSSVVTPAGNTVFLTTRTSTPRSTDLTTVGRDGLVRAPRHLTLTSASASVFGYDGILIVGKASASQTAVAIGTAAGGPLRVRALPSRAGHVIGVAVNASGDVAVIGGSGPSGHTLGPQARSVWRLRRGAKTFEESLRFDHQRAVVGATASVTPSGGILLAWQQNSQIRTRRSTPAGTWGARQALGHVSGDGITIHAVTDDSGRQTVAWRTYWAGVDSEGYGLLEYATAASGKPFGPAQTAEPGFTGSAGAFILVPGGPAGTLLAWTGADDQARSVVRAATLTGGVLGAAQQLSTNGMNSVLANAAVGPAGQAVVSWDAYTYGTTSTPAGDHCLHAAARTASGPFGADEQISQSCDYDQTFIKVETGLAIDADDLHPIASYVGRDGNARMALREPIAG